MTGIDRLKGKVVHIKECNYVEPIKQKINENGFYFYSEYTALMVQIFKLLFSPRLLLFQLFFEDLS